MYQGRGPDSPDPPMCVGCVCEVYPNKMNKHTLLSTYLLKTPLTHRMAASIGCSHSMMLMDPLLTCITMATTTITTIMTIERRADKLPLVCQVTMGGAAIPPDLHYIRAVDYFQAT